MVAPNEALPARAENIIPIIISQDYGLVYPTAAIAQVCCLRYPFVDTKTFYVTW